jgi:hypothetical protein
MPQGQPLWSPSARRRRRVASRTGWPLEPANRSAARSGGTNRARCASRSAKIAPRDRHGSATGVGRRWPDHGGPVLELLVDGDCAVQQVDPVPPKCSELTKPEPCERRELDQCPQGLVDRAGQFETCSSVATGRSAGRSADAPRIRQGFFRIRSSSTAVLQIACRSR